MATRRPTTGLAGLLDEPDPLPVGAELGGVFERDRAEHRVTRTTAAADDAHEQMRASSFMDWAQAVPTAKRPMDFERFAFQRELYGPEWEYDQDGGIVKATQIGVSENLLRWALRWSDRGRTALYVLPKGNLATEFSTMRLGPVIAASSYLRARTKATEKASDTKRLKAIGFGFFAMRGSQSKDELDSVDADVLVLDEYDRLVQAHIGDAEQRVTGPLSEGLIRRASTPTIPNFGISRFFRTGDMRRWHVRCGGLSRKGKRGAGCGAWNMMAGSETMERNVDRERMLLVCHDCRRPLDVTQGQYVAERPDVALRTYHLPKFVVPGLDLGRIVANSEKTSPLDRKTHHNKDLGEGWQDEQAGLSQNAIDSAVRDFYMDREGYRGAGLVTMGVDIATSRALNVRISLHLDEHTKRMLWTGEVEDKRAPWGATRLTAYEILAECMSRYNVHTVVLDNEPGGRLTRAFCERFRGRAWRCVYTGERSKIIVADEPELQVKVRRLEAIDSALDLIRNQKNLLARDRPEGWDAHLKALVLNVEEDEETGKLTQEWVKTGPDDFAHAEVYDVIATHMAYVAIYEGAAEVAHGTIAESADAVTEAGDWQRAGGDHDDIDTFTRDDDDPVQGW